MRFSVHTAANRILKAGESIAKVYRGLRWWPPIVSSTEMQHVLGVARTLLNQSVPFHGHRFVRPAQLVHGPSEKTPI